MSILEHLKRIALRVRLKRKLTEFEAQCSEKNRQWAQDLRRRLANASPQGRSSILMNEAQRIHEQHMRVLERIERSC